MTRRLARARRGVVGLLAALSAMVASSGAASAQTVQVNVGYRCDVAGAPGELLAGVELMSATRPPGGFRATYVWGVILTPGSRVIYGGEMRTRVARYVFVGEGAYAEFTDLETGYSFIVEFVSAGDDLVLIVNPFGPQTYRIPCELALTQENGRPPRLERGGAPITRP